MGEKRRNRDDLVQDVLGVGCTGILQTWSRRDDRRPGGPPRLASGRSSGSIVVTPPDDLSLAARLGPLVRGAVEVFLARHSHDVATIDVEDAYREAMTQLLDEAADRPISEVYARAVARERALVRHGARREAFDDLTGRSPDAEERRHEGRDLGARRNALVSDARLLLALSLDDALGYDEVAACVGGAPGDVVKAIARARREARSAEPPDATEPPDAPGDDGPAVHVGAAEIAARIEGLVIATDDRINGHLARCPECRAALREVALVPTHESPPPRDPDEQFGAGPPAPIGPRAIFDPEREALEAERARSPLAIAGTLLVTLGLIGAGGWYAFRPEAPPAAPYAADTFEGEMRRDGEKIEPTAGMELRAGDELRTVATVLITTHPSLRYGHSPTDSQGAVVVVGGSRLRVEVAAGGELELHLLAGEIAGLKGDAERPIAVRTTGAVVRARGKGWRVARFPEATENELGKWIAEWESHAGRDVTLARRGSGPMLVEPAGGVPVPVVPGDLVGVIDGNPPRSLLR